MVDKELQIQMLALGHVNAGFAKGLAVSLYVGNILWNNCSMPSNLSPFTIFELDPISTTQAMHCLQLHLLSKNTEGKLLNKIKASQIQEMKVPTTFEELHQTLLFYLGITLILFGAGSAIVAGMKSFATAILSEKIIFKGRIATDGKLLAMILYAMEIRIQRLLGECLKFEDWLMVNDCLISFDEVFKMVMNSTMNVSLPPYFVKPTPKTLRPPTMLRLQGKTASVKGGRRENQAKQMGSASPKRLSPSPNS